MDHERQPDLVRHLDLGGERPPLGVARRVVAVEVEAALADRDDARTADQVAHDGARVGDLAGLVRVDADDSPHAREAPGQRHRLIAADREDAAHARLGRGRDDVLRRSVAHLEVRVGVDHAPAGARRGKSGGGCSTVVPGAVSPSPALSQPVAPGSPIAARIRSEAAGMYG